MMKRGRLSFDEKLAPPGLGEPRHSDLENTVLVRGRGLLGIDRNREADGLVKAPVRDVP